MPGAERLRRSGLTRRPIACPCRNAAGIPSHGRVADVPGMRRSAAPYTPEEWIALRRSRRPALSLFDPAQGRRKRLHAGRSGPYAHGGRACRGRPGALGNPCNVACNVGFDAESPVESGIRPTSSCRTRVPRVIRGCLAPVREMSHSRNRNNVACNVVLAADSVWEDDGPLPEGDRHLRMSPLRMDGASPRLTCSACQSCPHCRRVFRNGNISTCQVVSAAGGVGRIDGILREPARRRTPASYTKRSGKRIGCGRAPSLSPPGSHGLAASRRSPRGHDCGPNRAKDPSWAGSPRVGAFSGQAQYVDMPSTAGGSAGAKKSSTRSIIVVRTDALVIVSKGKASMTTFRSGVPPSYWMPAPPDPAPV